jgi:hypothetical protein
MDLCNKDRLNESIIDFGANTLPHLHVEGGNAMMIAFCIGKEAPAVISRLERISNDKNNEKYKYWIDILTSFVDSNYEF